MRRSLLPAVLSLSVLLGTVIAAQDASYTFTTIDVPNAFATAAVDINNQGQVIGYLSSAKMLSTWSYHLLLKAVVMM